MNCETMTKILRLESLVKSFSLVGQEVDLSRTEQAAIDDISQKLVDCLREHRSAMHSEKPSKVPNTAGVSELVHCEVCGDQVRKDRLKRHKVKVHDFPGKQKKAVKARKKLKLKKMPPKKKEPSVKAGDLPESKRRKHLNQLFYPDQKDYSNDIFDRGGVVSGGGMGLGKKR